MLVVTKRGEQCISQLADFFTILELTGYFLSSSTIVEYLVRIGGDRWFGTLVSMLGPRGVLPEVPSAHESPNQVGIVRVI